jgi:hypothetical protein
MDDKKKGADDREVQVDSSNPYKKLWSSTCLNVKWELALITFLWDNLDIFTWQMSDMLRIPREVD